MSDPNPARLEELARQVAEQHVEMSDAISDERSAEEALLAQIVEAVRPALRALSNRLRASRRVWWPDNVSTATEETHHDARGIVVDGDGPQHDFPRANEGQIVGEDLVLLDDGSFARRDWTGSWTRWQGRTSVEESTLTPLTLAQVVADYDVDEIAESIRERLEEQLSGRAPKRTAAARERAEKLRAVSTILGGRK